MTKEELQALESSLTKIHDSLQRLIHLLNKKLDELE